MNTFKILLPAAIALAMTTPAFAATENFLLVNNGAPGQMTPGYDQNQNQQPGVPNTGSPTTTTATPTPTQQPPRQQPGVPNTGAGGNAGATEAALVGSLALAAAGIALLRRYSAR